MNNFQAEGCSLTDGWPYEAYEVSLIGGEDGGEGVGARTGGVGARSGARILKYSILSAICSKVNLFSGSYCIQLSHISHTKSQVILYHFNKLETYNILQVQQFLDPRNLFQEGADNYDLVLLIC